jgi:hypothetical protein
MHGHGFDFSGGEVGKAGIGGQLRSIAILGKRGLITALGGL